jgi:hypothetical protein
MMAVTRPTLRALSDLDSRKPANARPKIPMLSVLHSAQSASREEINLRQWIV